MGAKVRSQPDYMLFFFFANAISSRQLRHSVR